MTADNAIALWADLDLSAINESLGNLGPDFDIDLLGIANFKIDVAENGLTDEDAVPEPPVEPKTKLGDVYQLGSHRLMCGDSTSIDAVDKLMDGDKADMVFTDPPYGYQYESNHQKKHKMLENDDKILDFLPNAFSAMTNNSSIFVCGSHQTICEWKPLLERHFDYKNLIVWKKNNWSMGDLKGSFAGQHELILYGTKGRVELIGERSRDVWEFDRDPPKDHPTQKPTALIEFAISKVTAAGMIVLDFFGGSGSTLIACQKTGRKCFMMELDPRYCDVIVRRWEEFTGKNAELVTSK
jgi:DNA modification methylase